MSAQVLAYGYGDWRRTVTNCLAVAASDAGWESAAVDCFCTRSYCTRWIWMAAHVPLRVLFPSFGLQEVSCPCSTDSWVLSVRARSRFSMHLKAVPRPPHAPNSIRDSLDGTARRVSCCCCPRSPLAHSLISISFPPSWLSSLPVRAHLILSFGSASALHICAVG
ncbi:hypothetical protein DFH07DRAFT_12842 [Mycena maculata]|uniref:Uncharacterized protein n=1 Tax=Mycena maculata TaxID=230809 RepID=A0AAD7K438_9AGAR|nr:hypothetical protein DFH07DRAFT_12842 [Mycena maculata]